MFRTRVVAAAGLLLLASACGQRALGAKPSSDAESESDESEGDTRDGDASDGDAASDDGDPSSGGDAGSDDGNPTGGSDAGSDDGNPTSGGDAGSDDGNPTDGGDAGSDDGNPSSGGNGTDSGPDPSTTGGDGCRRYGEPDPDCCVDESPIELLGIDGSVCGPDCSGGIMCPSSDFGDPQCAFGTDPMNPTHCLILCDLGASDCPPGASCKDAGSNIGICTYP